MHSKNTVSPSFFFGLLWAVLSYVQNVTKGLSRDLKAQGSYICHRGVVRPEVVPRAA